MASPTGLSAFASSPTRPGTQPTNPPTSTTMAPGSATDSWDPTSARSLISSPVWESLGRAP